MKKLVVSLMCFVTVAANASGLSAEQKEIQTVVKNAYKDSVLDKKQKVQAGFACHFYDKYFSENVTTAIKKDHKSCLTSHGGFVGASFIVSPQALMADKGQGAKSIKTTRLIKMAEPAVSDLVALVNVDVEIQDGSNKGYQQPVFHFLEKTKKGWKIVNGLVMSSSEKQPCLIREGSFGYLEENQIKLYKEAKGCYAESR